MTSQSDSGSQAGEQRYRQLFEHMPICIFVADLTVTPPILLEANRRAQLRRVRESACRPDAG